MSDRGLVQGDFLVLVLEHRDPLDVADIVEGQHVALFSIHNHALVIGLDLAFVPLIGVFQYLGGRVLPFSFGDDDRCEPLERDILAVLFCLPVTVIAFEGDIGLHLRVVVIRRQD